MRSTAASVVECRDSSSQTIHLFLNREDWYVAQCEPPKRSAVGSSTEALAALLSSLMSWQAARTLSEALLERFGSLSAVLAASAEQLTEVPGMTAPLVASIFSLQLMRQAAALEEIAATPVIGHEAAVRAYLQTRLSCRPVEHAVGLFLDKNNVLIAEETLAIGTNASVMVCVRQIVRRALYHEASGLILAHNHPSGDPTPSRQDKDWTRMLAQVLAAVDLVLHDHIIIGHNTWHDVSAQ